MSSVLALDPAFVAWSVEHSARQEALDERPLLVLLHGRGSHEHDLLSLLPLLPTEFVVASLRAPVPLGTNAFGWFPTAEPGLPSGVAADASVESLFEWLDSIVTELPVSVLGFSQGAAMAIHAMRHRPHAFAAHVALAGFVIPGEQGKDVELETVRPPVFWGRDENDPVIPHDAIDRTSAWLPGHSTLTMRTYDAIGHSISREELDDVSKFLTETVLG